MFALYAVEFVPRFLGPKSHKLYKEQAAETWHFYLGMRFHKVKRYATWKINMESRNHPIEKWKSSSKPSYSGSMLNFQGCTTSSSTKLCLSLFNLQGSCSQSGWFFTFTIWPYLYLATKKKINRLWLQSPAHLLANLSLDHHHIASHQPGGVFLLEDWDDASSKSWKFHGLLKLEPYHPFEW